MQKTPKVTLSLMDWIQLVMLVIAIFTLLILITEVKESKNAQIVQNLISLNSQVYPCPRINEIITEMNAQNKLLRKDGGQFSEEEIDNFLGYFEMLGLIEQRGYLDLEIISNMFGYDVENIFRNRELLEYINGDVEAKWPYLNLLLTKVKRYEDEQSKKGGYEWSLR